MSYDGAPFCGWAAQAGLRTIQGELEAGLERILSRRTGLTVAGRTDAGVHAWSQVASFEADPPLPSDLRRRLDAVTPREIAVRSVEQARPGFDARRDARSRTYCYRVLAQSVGDPFERGRALFWPYGLDREALDACAAAALGRHDFTAFTPTQTAHVHFRREVIRCEWVEGSGLGSGEILELWVQADAFLRSMVRILVGTMLEIGAGRRPPADFEALLEGAPRRTAGETAPAHGLYFARVTY
ncbi:MAG: tRNA pseudouridine(38-40) synthase TruA [bacterium]